MRAKFINEFTRGGDPFVTLGIGRVGKIQKWFRDLGILDDKYEITPTEVIFKDTLDLRDRNVTWLPDGLKVSTSLYLNGCIGLTSLPDGLKVGGSLDLRGCTGLTSLPDGLKVGWDLHLGGCTGLTSLPDGLKVGGDLILSGCVGLTSLPDGLEVSESLDLSGCTGLTSLPDDLIVEHSIWVNPDQDDLIGWIRTSIFSNKLRVQ